MAPEQSSMPLQTMSYCQALMVSGSWVSSASSPPCGIENGLWLKSIFLAVSSYSNIGKSTIQQNAKSSSAITPSSWPTLVRAWPANFQAASGLSATKNTASPSSAPVSAFSLASRSPATNLAIGPLPAPPSSTM